MGTLLELEIFYSLWQCKSKYQKLDTFQNFLALPRYLLYLQNWQSYSRYSGPHEKIHLAYIYLNLPSAFGEVSFINQPFLISAALQYLQYFIQYIIIFIIITIIIAST